MVNPNAAVGAAATGLILGLVAGWIFGYPFCGGVIGFMVFGICGILFNGPLIE